MQPRSAMLCVCLILNVCLNAAEAQAPPHDTNAPLTAGRPQIAIVGTYHFVSKANVHSMPVDDPMTPKRQAEIEDLVRHLAAFHPTKVVLEQTSGTSDLEQHYQQYIRGSFRLEPSENYQVGFRIAHLCGLPRIYTINAWTDFNYDAVVDFAQKHGQMALIDASNTLADDASQTGAQLQKNGTVLDMYGWINSEEAVRANNSAYMYLARIGNDSTFVGADLVAKWHLRNLEMFAKLTRLIDGPEERILVLYGQGHAYLLRDFVRESPDLALVDVEPYLKLNPDEAAIRKIMADFEADWAKCDAKALAGLWTEDGDFLSPYGNAATGREQIEKFYAGAFASGYCGSKVTGIINNIRFVRGGVAVVDGTWDIKGARDQKGGSAPEEKGRFTAVAIKRGDHWLIVAQREMIRVAP